MSSLGRIIKRLTIGAGVLTAGVGGSFFIYDQIQEHNWKQVRAIFVLVYIFVTLEYYIDQFTITYLLLIFVSLLTHALYFIRVIYLHACSRLLFKN